MAYAVDLISVLKSLFDFTLMKPGFADKANWWILKDAFEAYAKDLEQNHKVCRSTSQESQQNNQMMPLNRVAFRAKIKDLLKTV